MTGKVRPYLFYDSAVSICATCLRRVEAKILIKDERVYLEYSQTRLAAYGSGADRYGLIHADDEVGVDVAVMSLGR